MVFLILHICMEKDVFFPAFSFYSESILISYSLFFDIYVFFYIFTVFTLFSMCKICNIHFEFSLIFQIHMTYSAIKLTFTVMPRSIYHFLLRYISKPYKLIWLNLNGSVFVCQGFLSDNFNFALFKWALSNGL